ncbi:TRAP transporter permease [Haloferacaceae archaeon DSL9]
MGSHDDRGGSDGSSSGRSPPLTDDDGEALSEAEQEQLLEEIERKRSVRGTAAIIVAVIGIAFSIFQSILAARSLTFFGLQQLQANAIHVSFALVLAFLLFPPTDGTGAVSRRLGAIPGAVRGRVGESPIATASDRLAAGVRWFAVDADRNRITPADIVLSLVALITPWYMIRRFDEVNMMRVRGLEAGATLPEVLRESGAGIPVIEQLSNGLAQFILLVIGGPFGHSSFALVLGTIGILLVLEATRRTLGIFLMSLIASFIVYARYGYVITNDMPIIGVFAIRELAWASIVRDLWFTGQGIFGVPVTVSVRFIYIFILFGAFLEMSGAGKWFIDFAYSLTGHRRGGPAKASVVSSGFMGMLSGSSIANTVTTGAFTIPLMKKSGYSPEFSGAVESSASSGGQILPPVMGAAAFLIVEYTGTPYSEVITAAAIPAIAFFFGMWVMVHLEAARHGIGGLDRSMLDNPISLLKEGWFYLLPLILLLYFLVGLRLSIGRSGWFTIIAIVALISFIAVYNERTRIPLLGAIGLLFGIQAAAYATTGAGVVGALTGAGEGSLPIGEALTAGVSDLGTITILVSVLVAVFRPRIDAPLLELDDAVDEAADHTANMVNRPQLADNRAYQLLAFGVKSLESGARTATTVVIAVAAAGVVPGVIAVTGLGPNLTALIVRVSAESFTVMLILAGISAIILGLGMPTTVMYILLISMLGTALEEFGVALLAAHLFILYFGLMADVTPPVAVAAFAAAGVAKADELATGVKAFLLSLNKVMVPFAFVFSPGILLLRDLDDGDPSFLTTADVLDLGFFIPHVVIPIVGMFAGVFALGVTIIGYYHDEVSGVERVLFAVSSFLLMVPGLLLTPLSTVTGMSLYTLTLDLALRAAGAVLLVGLMAKNRRGSKESTTVEGTAPAAE